MMNQSETESSRGKTPRGRPKRNRLELAREKIVAAARALLRNRPSIAIQRRDVAMAAGVTPALVTYYFPSQRDLIDAAAKPVLDSYAIRIKDVLSSSDNVERKLRSVILVLLIYSLNDAYLIEKYIASLETSDESSVGEVSADLFGFFVSCCEQGYLKKLPPELIYSVIGGICRYIAQYRRMEECKKMVLVKREIYIECQADIIMSILQDGLIIGRLLTDKNPLT